MKPLEHEQHKVCPCKYILRSRIHYLFSKTRELKWVLRKVFKTPPFRIQEEGWGEFDMLLVLTPKDKGAEITIAHDLNFQSEHYETKHPIVSPYASDLTLNVKLIYYDL